MRLGVVHLMPPSQRRERHPAGPAVTRDLREDPHPRSHPLAEPSRPPDMTRRSHPRWGQNSCRHAGPTTIGDAPPQAGPNFTPKAASTGARSGDHTHKLILIDPATVLRLGSQPAFTGAVLHATAQRPLFRRWTGNTAHPHQPLAGLLALRHAASNPQTRALTIGAADH